MASNPWLGTTENSGMTSNRQVTLFVVIENNGVDREMRQTWDSVLFGSNSNEVTSASDGGLVGTPKVVKLFVEL